MRVIDAVWEYENLGCKVQEIIIEASDTAGSLAENLSTIDAYYQVVKLPAEQVELSEVLHKRGFYLSEALMTLEIATDESENFRSAEYHIMTEEEEDNLDKVIKAGLFGTDRISRDPHFSKGQSAQRYVNWIDDEKNRGGELLALESDGETVGFALLRQTGKDSCHSYLVGIYPEFAGKRLSYLIISSGILYARGKGCQTLTTSVSTNNPGSVRAHLKMGYLPIKIEYVFVKHLGS